MRISTFTKKCVIAFAEANKHLNYKQIAEMWKITEGQLAYILTGSKYGIS